MTPESREYREGQQLYTQDHDMSYTPRTDNEQHFVIQGHTITVLDQALLWILPAQERINAATDGKKDQYVLCSLECPAPALRACDTISVVNYPRYAWVEKSFLDKCAKERRLQPFKGPESLGYDRATNLRTQPGVKVRDIDLFQQTKDGTQMTIELTRAAFQKLLRR